jgi:hypothetical protein
MSDREDRWDEGAGIWRQRDLATRLGSALGSLFGSRGPADRIDSLVEGLGRVAEAVWFVTEDQRQRAATLIDEGLQLKRLRGHAVPGMYEPLVTRWSADAGALLAIRRRMIDGAWWAVLLTVLLIGWEVLAQQRMSAMGVVDMVASSLAPGPVGEAFQVQAADDFKRVFKNALWVALAAASIGSIAVLFLLHVRQPWRVIAAMFLVTIPVAAFGALGYDFAHRSNPVRVAEKDLTIQGRALNAAKLAHERATADVEGLKARRTDLEAEVRARELMLDNLKTADKVLPTNRTALDAVQQLSATRLRQMEEDLRLIRGQRDDERKRLATLRQSHGPLVDRLRVLAGEASAAGTGNAPAPGFADIDRERAALASQERQIALEVEGARLRERMLDERQQAKATEIAAIKVDQSVLAELTQLIPNSPEQAKEAEYIGGKGRITALRDTLSKDLARRKDDLKQLLKASGNKNAASDAEKAELTARNALVAAEKKAGEQEGKLLEAQATLFNSWGGGVGGGGLDEAKPGRSSNGGLHDKVAAVQDSVLQVTAVLASFVGANEFQVYMVVFAVVLLFPLLARTVLGSRAGRRGTAFVAVALLLMLVVMA